MLFYTVDLTQDQISYPILGLLQRNLLANKVLAVRS
jgi:hypothetical protein